MNTFTLSLLLLQQHESDVLPPGLDVSEKHIPVVSRKRAHGRYTLLCTQTGGWADICNIAAFYHPKKRPFLHYHNLQQDIAYQHTHPPSTSLIQFSVCTSQAWGYYKHWTWDQRTQGKGLEVPCDELTGKPSVMLKLKLCTRGQLGGHFLK